MSPVLIPDNVASAVTVNFSETVPPEMVKPVAAAVGINPLMLFAVATPRAGVTRVGETLMTKDDPVPVCELTWVSFPVLVMTPVKEVINPALLIKSFVLFGINGLLSISASPLAAFQSAFTFTSAPAAIPASLVASATG